MKRIVGIIGIALISVVSYSCVTANQKSITLGDVTYSLEWHDEFDESYLDTAKWAYRTDNKHRSIQLRENVAFAKGSLLLNLNSLEDTLHGQLASGAGIVSQRRFKYGYYEVKAKLGDGIDDDQDGKTDEGWHHSFWAMAAEINEKNEVSTTYPGIRRTEIDCYENPSIHTGRHEKKLTGLNNFTQHIIVWDENGEEWGRLPKPPSDRFMKKDFNASEWHTYGFEWTEAVVNFYVDGQLTKVANYPKDQFVHDDINVWLTAIAANWTGKDQENSIAVYDYFKFYTPVGS